MVTRTVGLLFWICLVNGAFGVDDDPLKEAKARMAIELARVESDIRQGLSEADRQASRDPIKARESYDRVRAMIERDGSLSEKRKAYLTDICRKKSVIGITGGKKSWAGLPFANGGGMGICVPGGQSNGV